MAHFVARVEYRFDYKQITEECADEAAQLKERLDLTEDEALRVAFENKLERDSFFIGLYKSERIIEVSVED